MAFKHQGFNKTWSEYSSVLTLTSFSTCQCDIGGQPILGISENWDVHANTQAIPDFFKNVFGRKKRLSGISWIGLQWDSHVSLCFIIRMNARDTVSLIVFVWCSDSNFNQGPYLTSRENDTRKNAWNQSCTEFKNKCHLHRKSALKIIGLNTADFYLFLCCAGLSFYFYGETMQ